MEYIRNIEGRVGVRVARPPPAPAPPPSTRPTPPPVPPIQPMNYQRFPMDFGGFLAPGFALLNKFGIPF